MSPVETELSIAGLNPNINPPRNEGILDFTIDLMKIKADIESSAGAAKFAILNESVGENICVMGAVIQPIIGTAVESIRFGPFGTLTVVAMNGLC
ncbi:MAG: hypothetical protein HKL80_06050 [Acidimicrobiales bacterium]|nr:hypothetical protein [Acidimicrobiales bacterium]